MKQDNIIDFNREPQDLIPIVTKMIRSSRIRYESGERKTDYTCYIETLKDNIQSGEKLTIDDIAVLIGFESHKLIEYAASVGRAFLNKADGRDLRRLEDVEYGTYDGYEILSRLRSNLKKIS